MMPEYRRLPDEFNRDSQSSLTVPEKRKSAVRKRMLTFFIAAALMFVLPLTVGVGLGTKQASSPMPDPSPDPAPVPVPGPIMPEVFTFKPGIYEAAGSYAEFYEDGSGWFYNGKYFLPMTWNPDTNEYRCAGVYPEIMNISKPSGTVYYAVSEGTVEVDAERRGIRIMDPFRQMTFLFTVSSKSFDTEFIDAYLNNPVLPEGRWDGLMIPKTEYVSAYVMGMETFKDHATLFLTDSDTLRRESTPVSVGLSMKDCVIQMEPAEPLEYYVHIGDREVLFRHPDPLEAGLFFTDEGMYIFTYLFSFQVYSNARQ